MKDEVCENACVEIYASGTTADEYALNSLNRLKKRLGLPFIRYEVKDGLVQILQLGDQAGPEEKTTRIPLRRRNYGRVAAAVLIPLMILAGTVGVLMKRKAQTPQHIAQEFMIPAGGVPQTVKLPDGSQVTLRENTTLVCGADFDQHRDVRLDGEAFFKVVRNEAKPFTVESGGLKVTVLGTEFNVDAPRDGKVAEVTLVSGKVAVESGGLSATLLPNQKAVIDTESHDIELTVANEGELLRLSGAKLDMEDVRIDDALRMTADYFGKSLVMPPGIADDVYITMAAPPDMTLEEILRSIIKISGTITYSMEGDTITVSRK
ncbi:MAG: FecR domain-containing protein [Rikenellaceae bacterium]|nr:FecR domain-containing protein [Rikenellaceae bacterium]